MGALGRGRDMCKAPKIKEEGVATGSRWLDHNPWGRIEGKFVCWGQRCSVAKGGGAEGRKVKMWSGTRSCLAMETAKELGLYPQGSGGCRGCASKLRSDLIQSPEDTLLSPASVLLFIPLP